MKSEPFTSPWKQKEIIEKLLANGTVSAAEVRLSPDEFDQALSDLADQGFIITHREIRS